MCVCVCVCVWGQQEKKVSSKNSRNFEKPDSKWDNVLHAEHITIKVQ